ncbi:hypothetical protein AT5A_27673, partial [Agrobacterium tumefaciens 5A]
MSAAKTSGGTFAPLAQPVFAVLWIATVLGNTGSFMRDVASSWLMTDLSASPAAVAMVQAAGTLPIFLLAIPAGVLTDILDRRKFLIAVQLLLASVSISLMVLSQTGMLSVSALIGLTFLGGVGAALMGPTWQAIVPELVKREDVKSAVALNSLGINIARSIGQLLAVCFWQRSVQALPMARTLQVISSLSRLWCGGHVPKTPTTLYKRTSSARSGLAYVTLAQAAPCMSSFFVPPSSSHSPVPSGHFFRWLP